MCLVACGVMGLEQVHTEIILVVTPHGVNKISFILRAIHVNKEAGRLDAVVMQAPASNCPGQPA